jgi:hypothetical protein
VSPPHTDPSSTLATSDCFGGRSRYGDTRWIAGALDRREDRRSAPERWIAGHGRDEP